MNNCFVKDAIFLAKKKIYPSLTILNFNYCMNFAYFSQQNMYQ